MAHMTAAEVVSGRWQESCLAISFRSCQLTGAAHLGEALRTAGDGGVQPSDVGHLDLGENELTALDELAPFSRLLSLDVSHNSVDSLPVTSLPRTLLHLNAAYNRLESVDGIGALTQLAELNLSYNLLTSCAPLEALLQLQLLFVGGNRIASLNGLASLARLELIDLRFNYVEKAADLRLLALNAALYTLTLQGNPVSKLPNYRALVASTLPALISLDGAKMPRSSAQRKAGCTARHPSLVGVAPAFSGGSTTTATRPSQHKPVHAHTRYGGGAPTRPPATPRLTLLSATGTEARGPGAGVGALNTALRRSVSASTMQFVPEGVADRTPRQRVAPTPPPTPPAPRSATTNAALAASGLPTGSTMRSTMANARGDAATAGAVGRGGATGVVPAPPAAAPPAAGGAGRHPLLKSGERKGGGMVQAVAAAVASKEAALAMRAKLHAACDRTPRTAPSGGAAGGGAMRGGAAGGGAPSATACAACAPLATSGIRKSGSATAGSGRLGLTATASSERLGLTTTASSERLGLTTDHRGLTRSMSAESTRPSAPPSTTPSLSTRKVCSPTDPCQPRIPQLDGPHMASCSPYVAQPANVGSHSARAPAHNVVVKVKAPAAALSAEKGMMERAFEVGCGLKVRHGLAGRRRARSHARARVFACVCVCVCVCVRLCADVPPPATPPDALSQVQQGVFVPSESPVTLLESLLKMQAS